jgi:NAD(P)H-dependent flavin oxidoreductase YrpB (nitropropane dioxygenase family)
LPYWIGGSYGDAGGLERAEAVGAHGIQVGTLFAFSDESGLDADYKRRVIENSRAGKVSVFTDPVGSPTGFPFKVINLPGTNALQDLYEDRKRVCDLGYLREAYETDKGQVGWRCASEPLASYERRGGDLERTKGRKCLCNGLMANIGMAQHRRKSGEDERALLTAGDHAKRFAEFLPEGVMSYSALDVIKFLKSETALIGG